MNEESKGNIGGNIPTGSTDQKGKNSPHVFHTEGMQHFNYSPKLVVTVGLVSFVFTIIVGTLMGYKSAISEIDTGISNHKELNNRLADHDSRIKRVEERTTKSEGYLDNIFCYITKGKDPRCK